MVGLVISVERKLMIDAPEYGGIRKLELSICYLEGFYYCD